MAPLTDFISRIFSTDRTQGLSGGAEVVVDQDPSSAFYLSRLRKHRTDEDLVEHPEYLWATASYGGRKGGLRAHVHAERGDGVASFTDVLVVVNQADWERTLVSAADPWKERAERALLDRFAQYCDKERFELLYGTRPLRVALYCDGGAEMLNQSFGLGPGEFVTGLLPNLYAGPGLRSRPVVAVHLNLPGLWEGYREVGRLYSDQILFTLGRHWLDNYHHPALREPGIYRLQQYPDGSLVHVISPELQDRYHVRSDTVDGGTSVLTIAEWDGNPVAWLVLAVVDASSHESAPPPRPAELPDHDDHTEISLPEPTASPRLNLAKTIVPGALATRILSLQERGALLQKVHFSNFMDGYDVYIGPGGRVATQLSEPRATIQVRGNRVSLLVHDPSVVVDGRPVGRGKTVPLNAEVSVEVDGHRLVYRDLSGVRADGWPYLGELRRPGAGAYLEFGVAHRVGRDRRCKVRLPDEPHNDNIAWLPSVGGGTTIRSRNGDIPKSRFYTDSIMVASEHAEIDLGAEPLVRSLARHCHTFLRRGDRVISLSPREGGGGLVEAPLENNDELLVGNCLFQVSFPPADGTPSRHPTTSVVDIPRPSFSPEDLAASVDERRGTTEPPPVVAAGETAPAPRPLPAEETWGRPRTEVRQIGLATLSQPSQPSAPAAPVPPPPPPIEEPPVRPPPPMLLGTVSSYGEPPVVLAEDPSPLPPVRGPHPKAPAEAPPPPEPARAAPRPPDGRTIQLTPSSDEEVVAVEEREWQFELSRPARLVLVGWMVSGEVTVGNHRGCAVVVPEVCAYPEQAFMTLTYARLRVRGRKGRVELLQPGEATLTVGGAPAEASDTLDDLALAVIRRDEHLDPDFEVRLGLADDPSLPDPRARLLRVDPAERLALGLFTLGLPLRDNRRVNLGEIAVSVRWDGEAAVLSDYLEGYRRPEGGYRPFFVRTQGSAFHTVPEDGSPVRLAPGDAVIAGIAVYELRRA